MPADVGTGNVFCTGLLFSTLLIELSFCYTFIFDSAHQVLEGVYHSGADIAANENIHDIVAYLELTLIEPDLDVVHPVHFIGIRDNSVYLGLIIGKDHTGNRAGISGSLTNGSLGGLTNNSIVGQIHSHLGCTFMVFRFLEPLVDGWERLLGVHYNSPDMFKIGVSFGTGSFTYAVQPIKKL